MNFEEIKELIKILSESTASKLSIKNGEFELLIEKGGVATEVALAPQPTPIQQKVDEATTTQPKNETKSNVTTLNSPMVGTFYAAPAPNAKKFVQVGDKVAKGQTIAILEAMKIMNEWEAEFDCKILKVLVEDGQPVEYGTPIFEVEKL